MSKEVNEERTPRTVADVKEMLTKHSNGEIQRTIQNCITILQNDHVLADAIRLNLLSERIDIVKPVGWPRSGKPLNDTDMKYILRRMEKYGISSEKKIESAIRIVANENRYHPIRDYLNGLKWGYKCRGFRLVRCVVSISDRHPSVSSVWRGRTQQRSCWICRRFAPDNTQ